MRLLAHLGQGFLMIYRLERGSTEPGVIQHYGNTRMWQTHALLIGLIQFVYSLQQVYGS